MEAGDLYQVFNSSSLWWDRGQASFSRSFREDHEDEEALKWAALERLPTYGLLTTTEGTIEVDVKLTLSLDWNGSYLHLIANRKKHLHILNDVSGIIKPYRMTLLLGPPSSGKTTLLKALAGKLDPDLKAETLFADFVFSWILSGNVTYNGHWTNEFVPQITAAYISQNDVHIPEMTVRAALSFSARYQGVGSRYEMLAELMGREKAADIKPDPYIDVFMKAASTDGQETKIITDYVIKDWTFVQISW
ncbi:Pleiotropic drug resistance transporter 1 [Melia azedarach]|uniref:Pleiotropic drug resistance transporter 1 n=1 Tax=Melia azedarach TaxID=155640 RepID=A0ACC1Y512_MELAZ|nr:Pleiotropic drug resistance transporter 1 [Melia azedarach]